MAEADSVESAAPLSQISGLAALCFRISALYIRNEQDAGPAVHPSAGDCAAAGWRAQRLSACLVVLRPFPCLCADSGAGPAWRRRAAVVPQDRAAGRGP